MHEFGIIKQCLNTVDARYKHEDHQLMCFPTMRLTLRGCRLYSSLIILFGCVGNMVPSDRMIVSDELGMM